MTSQPGGGGVSPGRPSPEADGQNALNQDSSRSQESIFSATQIDAMKPLRQPWLGDTSQTLGLADDPGRMGAEVVSGRRSRFFSQPEAILGDDVFSTFTFKKPEPLKDVSRQQPQRIVAHTTTANTNGSIFDIAKPSESELEGDVLDCEEVEQLLQEAEKSNAKGAASTAPSKTQSIVIDLENVQDATRGHPSTSATKRQSNPGQDNSKLSCPPFLETSPARTVRQPPMRANSQCFRKFITPKPNSSSSTE